MLELERQPRAGGVPVLLDWFDVGLVHDEGAHRSHVRSLRRSLEQALLDDVDAVSEGDASRFYDLAVHPEGEVLLARLVRGDGTVRGERAQRVEVRDARLGVLRRDRTAAHVAAQAHERGADADGLLDPAVLAMRVDAVDLEEHAEATPVDGRFLAAVESELLERRLRNTRAVDTPDIHSGSGRTLHHD